MEFNFHRNGNPQVTYPSQNLNKLLSAFNKDLDAHARSLSHIPSSFDWNVLDYELQIYISNLWAQCVFVTLIIKEEQRYRGERHEN